VLHGFIGSNDRMELTIIGEAANWTARYCAGAAGGEVLISPALHQRLWRHIDAELTTIETKHEGNLTAYRLTGLKNAGPASSWRMPASLRLASASGKRSANVR